MPCPVGDVVTNPPGAAKPLQRGVGVARLLGFIVLKRVQPSGELLDCPSHI